MVLDQRVVLLVGGVGGAKLAYGLAQILPPENLTIIVNTGDDMWHYGLRICPDLDTVMYTLAGVVNSEFGWGLADDTRIVLESLREHYDEEPWFGLGDKDFATHLLRTHRLKEGDTLTQVTERLAGKIGVKPRLLPMTDSPVATVVNTVEYGELAFQQYFVRYRWEPTVTALRFEGAEWASLPDAVSSALQQADILVIGPSNPWLSIAPILAIPAMRDAITSLSIPRIAVTPIVNGQALKGPAAKLMAELGYEVSAQTVAAYYGDVINGFVYDEQDHPFQIENLHVIGLNTIMKTHDDKVQLARAILELIREGVL